MEIVGSNPVQKVVVNALRKNISLLNQDNKSKEVPVIHRVLLFTPSIRKHLDLQNLELVIRQYISDKSLLKEDLLRVIGKYNEVCMHVDGAKVESKDIVEYYVASILIFQLLTIDKYDDCYELSKKLIHHFQTVGYMDKQKEYILCRIYTYLLILHNRGYSMPTLLSDLLKDYRMYCLHNNFIICCVLYNSILRMYIHEKQFMTAAHFIDKTKYPSDASDKQFVRYCYYRALVSTVLLDYTEAEHSLFTIYKKSGDANSVFSEEVAKLTILVKLLIGENPDLTQIPVTRQLRPYRDLAIVVMRGDLSAYRSVMENKQQQFSDDGLSRIINRLLNTVIRIALVKMAKSYSRISLQEIATILELDDAEEARYTCMRNIRDGIIAGHIEGDHFVAEDLINAVTTGRPRELFSKKIAFCLNLRQEIVKRSV